MKILHTADWHIGKKLHKHVLSEDFELFVSWLIQTVKERSVDVILVSGDVFDLANPSNEARKQYYAALIALSTLKCQLIITGGNHDSADMLNAPKEILEQLQVTVIGGFPENIADTIIPIRNKNGQTEMVVAAIPYLRDMDLRKAQEGQEYEDVLALTREGIAHIFKQASGYCMEEFPNVPALAMGHLFVTGIETSESERDIQIGNQATFDAGQFGDYFKYVALGHIHKPQKVNGSVPIFYSGSPIPLSFSEREYQHRVLLIDTDAGFEPENIAIPVFRKLQKIAGDLDTLSRKLHALPPHTHLDSLLEVELIEDTYDAQKMYALDQLVSDFDAEGYEIVKHRAQFKNQRDALGSLLAPTTHLEDLEPRDVFLKKIEGQEYEDEVRAEIVQAFDAIMEEVQQAGGQ